MSYLSKGGKPNQKIPRALLQPISAFKESKVAFSLIVWPFTKVNVW